MASMGYLRRMFYRVFDSVCGMKGTTGERLALIRPLQKLPRAVEDSQRP